MEITTNWVAKRIEKNFTVTETGSPRDFSSGSASKESTCPCRRYRRCRFDPWVRKSPWSRKWQPILVFLPGKSHGQKSLVGYSPWSCKELDMTECVCVHACACAHTHTHTGSPRPTWQQVSFFSSLFLACRRLPSSAGAFQVWDSSILNTIFALRLHIPGLSVSSCPLLIRTPVRWD